MSGESRKEEEIDEVGSLNSEDEGGKKVTFDSEPPIAKTISGAYESLETRDPNETSTMSRRFSSLRPNFEHGAFGNLSSIPPPVPESLPTTPGFELSNEMYFNRKDPLHIPEQQGGDPNVQTLTSAMLTLTSTNREDSQPLQGMTLKNPERNLWRVMAACGWTLAAGLSDGAPGAILNDIEDYYNISYSIVSLIWLSNAIGFILVAVISDKMDSKLGKRKMISGGCITTFIMYAIVSSGTKFPAICVGFFFGGVGLATCLTQINIFLSRFEKASTYLGWFHGTYGIGATLAPIIAASMVNAGVKWHYFYLILLGMAILNLINLWFAFKNADEDTRPWDHQEVIHTEDNSTPTDEIALNDLNLRSNIQTVNTDYREPNREFGDAPLPPEPVIPKGDFKLAIKNLRTWLLTLFVFFYQGAEVSLPGWFETFLTDYRNGDPEKLGYVASGFWAGLTIGRLFLVERIHTRFGAKRGVSVLILGALVCVAIGWAIDNIIVEAVIISISGIFVGPIYPLMITIATRVLPRKIQVVTLTIMTSGGSSGGALWPFLTGLISQFSGAFVVMPMFISLFATMVVCWFVLPNPDRSIVKKPWERLF